MSPEAVGVLGRPLHVTQATWSSPAHEPAARSRRAYGGTFFGVGNFEREPNPTRDLIRVAEQCASGCAANGNIPGLVYRSQDFSVAHTGSYLWKGSVVVRHRHAQPEGRLSAHADDRRSDVDDEQSEPDLPLQQRRAESADAVDFAVGEQRARRPGTALFVQEQWTRDRLTLQGAVRFDRARSWFPAQQEGPSRFLPTPIVIPETRGVDSYKDITPQDGRRRTTCSGRGRTALKMSLGKYLEGAGVSGNYANTNPTLRMPQTTSVFGTAGVTRAWTDANRNFVPDCDLLNPAAQDLRASGGDLCGVMSNTNFGKNVLTNNFDPAILDGWGVRPSDWNLGVSIQQQIGSRSSVDVTYTRRWFDGFFVVDNLALAAIRSDAVQHRGARRIRDCPAAAATSSRASTTSSRRRPDRSTTSSPIRPRYGTWYQYFNGLDVTVNVRVGQGLHARRRARAPVRPSPTTATCARTCRSSRPRRPGRARSAPA